MHKTQKWRLTLRKILGFLSYYCGLVSLVRRCLPRQGALIFYGHRVAEDDEGFFGGIPPIVFERQMRYLSQFYNFIPLSSMVASLYNGKPIQPNSVVLTLDDGFGDNYTHAFPILRKYGIPATIFLCINSVERGELPWSQRLGYIFQHTERDSISLESPVYSSFSLRTTEDRLKAYRALAEQCKSLHLAELERYITVLGEICGVDVPLNRMLTWEQIREMRQHGIEFGSHTLSHPHMASLPLEQAYQEMAASKQVLEQRLGEPIHHFAFPAGSYTNELIEMARQIGYTSLFVRSRSQHVNTHETDPFALRRVGLADDPIPVLATEAVGIFDLMRQVVR
jgi:peptidoglycan/xylan/chitin deacetylase (PgdA/CDA1 family)